MTGRIFDIKHYAIHDGPGIRTTFFFLGCPLRCVWCQNPESQSYEPYVQRDQSRCIDCGSCRDCPAIDELGYRLSSRCIRCFRCAKNCPSGALTLVGREATVDELLACALEERPFYETSGGGVTCSGGECLLQARFLSEFLSACKAEGIHTAVDTCGQASLETIEQVAPYTDLFLYDIKLLDAERHMQYTGVSNERILENLKWLYRTGALIRIRVPMIPGITDTAENVASIATWMRKNTPKLSVELLQYNALAASKYEKIPFYADQVEHLFPLKASQPKPQTREKLEQLCAILMDANVQASYLCLDKDA